MTNTKLENFRPPIVTLMGHVDHGKTTLLDTIRKTNVVAGEHGGITQHIGAYQIVFNGKPITFIDTPGHAAFEKMRSRGAEAADIVILVVAANDGVKPQTIEAIKHIKKAQKPIIVAITKTDLPNINIDKAKKGLQDQDVVIESYGGQVPVVEVAATKGQGINDLLEVIELLWQISPQPYLPDNPLEAVVVESYLDKNRGAIVSVIPQKGTLKVGNKIQIDGETITIRALVSDTGESIKEAPPGKPCEILGFKKAVDVGTIIRDTNVTHEIHSQQPASLSEIIAKSQEVKDKFKIVVKADVLGSLEAILANLPQNVLVVSSGVGEVQANDINFAKLAHAPILAFNVKTSSSVKQHAEREGVMIRPYQIIYELISDIEDVSTGFEAAKQEKKIKGQGQIVAIFNIDGKKVAGSKITKGKLKIGDEVIIRSPEGQRKESTISSIKKFKKDVEFVLSGQDCGIGFSTDLDFKEGDVVESLG